MNLLGKCCMQGPYTVTVEVPIGVILANITGARTAGSPDVGNNQTLSYSFTSNVTLMAGGGNSTYMNISVFASSQVNFPDLQSPQTLALRYGSLSPKQLYFTYFRLPGLAAGH